MDGQLVFLFIGRLLRDKGVVEFVEAARRLRPDWPHARFQLLGSVDERNRSSVAIHQLRSWQEEGAIEYLGQTDDVRPFIAAASVIVLPSYREGLPRSLLEASAMARPLIATDVPGCRALVVDGLNGFLCKVRDSQALALAMERFARLKPEQRRSMGESARNKVQDGFSEKKVIRSYLEVLAALHCAKSMN